MSQPHQTTAATPGAPPVLPLTAARRRAARAEAVAARAELHRELRGLVGRVQGLLAGRRVLEIGCGGGWWTRHLAQAAQDVLAVDDDADLLRLSAAAAGAGRLPPGRVRFTKADLTEVEQVPGLADAGFAAFLPSTMAEEEAAAVLAGLHRRLGPGARVVLVDERAPLGGDDAILRRRLRDLAPDAQGVKLDLGPHFWSLAYTL